MHLRPRTLACALSLSLLAPACAGVSLGARGRLEESGAEPVRHVSFAELRWRLPLVPTLTDLDSRSRSRATPALDSARGVVYVGGLDRGVHAIRARDGATLWRFQTLGAVESTPTLDGRDLFVGSGDGALYALDARTGRQRWRFATVAEFVHAPVVTADTVYAVNGDDTVYALDRATGEQRWRYRREPPGGITGGGHAGLLRLGDRLVTGFSDGHTVALEMRDGAVAWEHDSSPDSESSAGANEAHRTIDVDTTPVLADGNVLVASYTAGLYALDPQSGTVRWRLDRLLNVSALATDGRWVYASSANAGLVKLSPSDGEVVWARDLGSRALAAPVVRGDHLLVSSPEGAVWLVRARDGEPLAGLVREGVTAPPLVTDDAIYLQTNRSVVYAWRHAL